MAPSLIKALGSAAAAANLTISSSSADNNSNNKAYKISEVYDSSNFFDKFNFVSVRE